MAFFFIWRSCKWSDVFFRVNNSTRQLLFLEQLFLQRSYVFLKSSFSRTVASSQQLFFQNFYFTSTEQHFPENRQFFKRVTFSEQLVFWWSNFFKLRSIINFFRTDTLSIKVLLQKRYFFRRSTFWKKLIFQKRNIPQ